MARLTVADITDKKFIENDYGYDKYDVDGFLDEICDEIETLTNERDNLQQRLDQAEKQQMTKAEPVQTAAPVSEDAVQNGRTVH